MTQPPPSPLPGTPAREPQGTPPAGSPVVYTDDQRKHLDFIQAVVSRLAGNQFLFKGWSLTVAVAVYGYAAAHQKVSVAIVGIAVACGFAGLDMFFLRQERLFRHVWKAAVGRTSAVYEMNPHAYDEKVRYLRGDRDEHGNERSAVVLSPPILGLYGMLVAGGLVLAIAIGVTGSESHPSHQPAHAPSSQSVPSPTPSR